jgi:drug/metabolite transporter (DMT)-like permease
VSSLSRQQLGFIIVLVAAFGYACLPIFTRAIYNASDMQPTDIALWRYIFGVPAIWLIIRLRQRRTTYLSDSSRVIPLRSYAILGLLYAGAALSAFVGLELISASVYVVLFFTYPTMVALLSALLGERLSLRAWGAVGLTLVGIFLTIPDWSALQGANLSGVLVALVNALFVAVYFLASSRLLRGIGSMAQGTGWIMLYTFGFLLLLLPFVGLQIPPNTTTWLLLLGLALFSTVMPLFTLNTGIQMIGASTTAIISSIEPVMTMLLALILLGEIIFPTQWLGVIAIIGAVVLLQIRTRKHVAS